MYHMLFTLTRPLIVFDTETTGTNVKKDRIVEIGFQLFTSEGLQSEWRSLVNPLMPIPPRVSEVHGITDDDMLKCRGCQQYETSCVCEKFSPPPPFKSLASKLAKGFSNCDFAGKNVRFDLRIMAAEMERAGVPWSYTEAYVIDAQRLEALGEPRTLSDLHLKHTGQELKGAHGALTDVQGTTRVICAQLDKYSHVLPRDLKALHELQWPGMLTVGGEFKMVDGEAMCTFGKFRDTPMRDIPGSYYDWILKNDFPADVKALARDAKLGKFPGDI